NGLRSTGTNGGSIDSLRTTATRALVKAELPAASITVRNSAIYGANAEVKITPPPGTILGEFTTEVRFGNTVAKRLFRSAHSIIVVATETGGLTGTVRLNALASTSPFGGPIDSWRAAAPTTIAQAAFPDASVQVRDGPLGAGTELKITPPSG